MNTVIFDLDGTLVESFTTTPLHGAKERIARLRAQGSNIAIATNQAGPIWYWVTEDAKFPSAIKIAKNIASITEALELQGVPWFVSIGDLRARDRKGENIYRIALQGIRYALQNELPSVPLRISGLAHWRKPSPGMLLRVAEYFDVEASQCLYVGDMDTDEQAARAAEMAFERA